MDTVYSYRGIFRKYFSDYTKWNVVYLFLFLITLLIDRKWGSSWGRYWLIPSLFLGIWLIALKLHVFYFQAQNELNHNKIQEKAIHVESLLLDKQYNFINDGGALVGLEKNVIVDTEGNKYRLMRDRVSVLSQSQDYYCGAHVQLLYLEKTHLILHMKLLSSDAPSKHLEKNYMIYCRSKSANQ